MPAKMHRRLAARARAKGYKGARYKRYVYGTMAKQKARKRRKH
jgi:hypothetical protein